MITSLSALVVLATGSELTNESGSEAYGTAWTVGALATPSLTAAYLPVALVEPPVAPIEARVGMAPIAEAGRDRSSNNYLTAKLSAVYPSDSDLDPGWMVGAAFGRYFTRLFAIEGEVGYLEPDVANTSSVDIYAVPLMLNARVSVPIWILEIYGGAGIGGIYYNVDGGALDGDGWLTGGNAFLGTDVILFDRLSAGLELKYYITEKLRDSDTNLDALALTLTLGFRF